MELSILNEVLGINKGEVGYAQLENFVGTGSVSEKNTFNIPYTEFFVLPPDKYEDVNSQLNHVVTELKALGGIDIRMQEEFADGKAIAYPRISARLPAGEYVVRRQIEGAPPQLANIIDQNTETSIPALVDADIRIFPSEEVARLVRNMIDPLSRNKLGPSLEFLNQVVDRNAVPTHWIETGALCLDHNAIDRIDLIVAPLQVNVYKILGGTLNESGWKSSYPKFSDLIYYEQSMGMKGLPRIDSIYLYPSMPFSEAQLIKNLDLHMKHEKGHCIVGIEESMLATVCYLLGGNKVEASHEPHMHSNYLMNLTEDGRCSHIRSFKLIKN